LVAQPLQLVPVKPVLQEQVQPVVWSPLAVPWLLQLALTQGQPQVG
jgi:hypothetical protein